MERRVGDALADLGRQLVHVTFALGEHVDQLGAATVAERLRHVPERIEQQVLRLPVTHTNLLLKESLDNIDVGPDHTQDIA